MQIRTSPVCTSQVTLSLLLGSTVIAQARTIVGLLTRTDDNEETNLFESPSP
jgi:hypothetical protein